jgi:hypothetical protein
MWVFSDQLPVPLTLVSGYHANRRLAIDRPLSARIDKTALYAADECGTYFGVIRGRRWFSIRMPVPHEDTEPACAGVDHSPALLLCVTVTDSHQIWTKFVGHS